MAAPEQTREPATPPKPGRLLLQRIFWIVLACFVALSIYSHNAQDPAWTQWGTGETLNAAGQFGAYLSDISGFLLGHVTYLVPLLLVWRVVLFWYQPPLALTGWRQAAAWLIALFSLAALLALHQYEPGYGLDNGVGGLIGRTLGLAMWQATGLIGGTLILGTIFVLTLTLASGLSWPWLLERLGRALWQAASWVGTHLSQRWQHMLQSRVSQPSSSSALESSLRRQEPVIRESSPAVSAKPVVSPRVPETQATPLDTPRTKPDITIQPMAEVKPAKKPEAQRQLFAPPLGEGSLPSLDLLDPSEPRGRRGYTPEALEAMSRLLEIKLKEFNVDAEVVAVQPGPVITRFEIQPAAGVKVARITNIAKDLARAMAMVSVRVVEVIPGKSVVGIEVPNQDREMVRLSEILTSHAFETKASPLTLALGKDIAGNPILADLARMPHLLVAGTTGSGKSVGVNAMILSMLFKATPAELRLIMIDPKMLELSVYDKIPHLLTPVVTDMKDAANALRWCVAEMERRYKLMSKLGVRNLDGYNKKVAEAIAAGEPIKDPLWRPGENVFEEEASELGKLPFIVVIIDEFADMIMIVGKKVEELIARIAQKARAAGIHLILATQRPSVDVITGLIKANVPTRIAFQVSSRIDSRTILDQGGAEMLLGHGDMLFLPPGTSLTERVHGAFVSDDEVHRVCGDWRARGEPDYVDEILEGSLEVTDGGGKGGFGGFDDVGGDPEQDALYDEAVAFVLETRRPSISFVQRKFKIGYNRAARLVEAMENAGVVSAMQSNGQREVVVPRRE